MTADPMDAARRALHLDVACPRCGAGADVPCRTSSGRYRAKVHAERTLTERNRPPAYWVQDELFPGAGGK